MWATLDRSAARAGIRAFVVDSGSPGMYVTKVEHTIGNNGYSTSFGVRRSWDGGTKDGGTTPAMAEGMANAIPESKLVLLEAAHLSNIERADEFNATLIEFLQGELAPPVTQA